MIADLETENDRRVHTKMIADFTWKSPELKLLGIVKRFINKHNNAWKTAKRMQFATIAQSLGWQRLKRLPESVWVQNPKRKLWGIDHCERWYGNELRVWGSEFMKWGLVVTITLFKLYETA